MLGGIVVGLTEQDVKYCPFCGEKLSEILLVDYTKCDKCGRSFFILEDNKTEIENKKQA